MSDVLVERLFHYTPSNAAAVIFIFIDIAIIMGIIYTIWNHHREAKQTLAEAAQSNCSNTSYHEGDTNNSNEKALDKRGVRLLWIVAITAAILIVGLGLRIQMTRNPRLTTFIVQQAFLIISPNALAFVNYALLGIILSASEKRDPTLRTTQPFYLRSQYVARLFLASDVLSFLVQSSSTPMLTNVDPSVQKQGQMMMVGGLSLQLVFFTMFTSITLYVHRKHTYASTRPEALSPLFPVLYFTITMLYIRSVYRLIEFTDGHAGTIASMEWLFYVADQVPVSACMAAYILLKPIRALQLAATQLAASAAKAGDIIIVVQHPSTFSADTQRESVLVCDVQMNPTAPLVSPSS